MTQKISTIKGQANMFFAYDNQGINVADKVPHGISGTAAHYRDFMQKLCRKVHKTDLLRDGQLILHNNMPAPVLTNAYLHQFAKYV